MTLNAVVFPAPFGPISPTISPARRSKDTSSSATMPPKRLVTFSTSRRGKGRTYARDVHPTAQRLQDRLTSGPRCRVQELTDSTRTAQEAADAVGADVGQIVKSLVFIDADGPVLCLCAGDRRVDTASSARRPPSPRLRGSRGDGVRDRRCPAAGPRTAGANGRRLVPATLRHGLVRRRYAPCGLSGRSGGADRGHSGRRRARGS